MCAALPMCSPFKPLLLVAHHLLCSSAALACVQAAAASRVAWRRFLNHPQLLSCLADQARGGSSDKGNSGRPELWINGWQGVLQEAGRLGQLAGCVGEQRSSGSGGECGVVLDAAESAAGSIATA
jgi:hypothetical protein